MSLPNCRANLFKDLLRTTRTAGVTEVKDEDCFKGIAQNAVQLESALTNRKRKTSEMDEEGVFVECSLDDQERPRFKLSKLLVIVYENEEMEAIVERVLDHFAWLLEEVQKPEESEIENKRAKEPRPDCKKAKNWEKERLRKQVYIHKSTVMDISGNTIGNITTGTTSGGTFIAGSPKEITSKKGSREELELQQSDSNTSDYEIFENTNGKNADGKKRSADEAYPLIPPPNLRDRTPPPHQAQVQLNSENDDDLHDQDENENASTEVQELIAKMEDVDHRLFEYRIVNLSEKSLVDPINKLFSDDDKKRMRNFWEEMEPSAEERQNTLRRPRWEKSIKPLIDKYALSVEVKPKSGEFDFKKHYDVLWVQDIYQRFMFLFASSFNMLRDANTLEIAYRESFVNPIIPKAFEDVNDKIRFQTESALRKQHRNQTRGQKPRVMLGSNHDGILKIYMNASQIEIGFLEVVGNAMVVDLKKYREDTEKLFKVMQLSIFYQRQHHLRRNATEKQLECLQSFGVLVYQRETTIYIMHRSKGGLYIVDILTNFTIPENKDQAYVLDEIVEKSRVMDYYLKLQEISRKAQEYTPSNENLLEASPPKKRQQKRDPNNY
ncbi:1120_t:CDS:10 [Ambispora gerdemannii]|uniref:1120_t:CDS:1 n=1 Tax=Ambispora gerdemannii TaxID=144530 RepID=A0A9N9G265_9GLOM|nr:1120_t:CDS:10 [Ambispora gerdemannii]